MKEIIATEQILSPLGHRVGLKYHYADGTSSEIRDGKSTQSKETTNSILKKLMKKK